MLFIGVCRLLGRLLRRLTRGLRPILLYSALFSIPVDLLGLKLPSASPLVGLDVFLLCSSCCDVTPSFCTECEGDATLSAFLEQSFTELLLGLKLPSA